MRSSKSRSRSKSNRNRSMGNIVNRVFDSSGPEGKVRGTPQQIIEKYNQLARDAQLSNDRVATENFQQHAEHYLRMLAEAQKEQQERQNQQQNNQNNQNQGDNRQNNNDNQQNNNNENRQNQPGHPQQGNAREDQGGQQNEPSRDNRTERKRQDDVIDVESETSESVLVETPENRAPKPRRTRKKAPEPELKADAETTAPPDAAE